MQSGANAAWCQARSCKWQGAAESIVTSCSPPLLKGIAFAFQRRPFLLFIVLAPCLTTTLAGLVTESQGPEHDHLDAVTIVSASASTMPTTQRWAFLLGAAVGLPTILTFFSLLHTHPRGDHTAQDNSRSSIGAFFSFHAPSSLFPPSAIISLTDDNSTFFLARPADFGPILKSSGLTGPLWIGSGFGDDDIGHGGVGTLEGELGCSDVPGWDEKFALAISNERESQQKEDGIITNPSILAVDGKSPLVPRSELGQQIPNDEDGTDDHLHQPLQSSHVTKPVDPDDSTHRETDQTGHADIQSLQESAEISGKVALLTRGGCGFLEKVKWAQRRGATALVVGDNIRGGALVTMYARGDTSNVTIPSVFTSHTTAHLLSSLMPLDEGYQIADKDGDAKMVHKKSKEKAVWKDPHGGPKGVISSQNDAVKSGWIETIRAAFGWRGHPKTALAHSDTRRPPSSGRLGVIGEKQRRETLKDAALQPATLALVKSTATKRDSRKTGSHDDFVIGEQDWRDPDLVVAKVIATKSISTSRSAVPSAIELQVSDGKEVVMHPSSKAALTGGSITPGSGEYAKPGDDKKKAAKDGKSSSEQASLKKTSGFAGKENKNDQSEEHEGLWITITPAAMSTSPFFDTLLVLVVSPLVTLTVVYALLLLRSRIRRRRWRAPKSVVERLPIRTYHTLSSTSTPASTRFSTPQGSSPTTPLLQHSPHSSSSQQSRPRSATTSGVSRAVERAGEKASYGQDQAAGIRPNKKYRTRHVECVVCLEEYIDGKSRVMSLPCGHEFHAECM